MVRAYHLIMTAYGFWLPNDPRGSWSTFVRAWDLRRFGSATTTHTRRSVAHHPHDTARRRAAKRTLARPPVRFTGKQAQVIGCAFSEYCLRSGCIIHACSILPAHVHLVVARHTCAIEQVANLLKGAATAAMTNSGLHPFGNVRYRNGRRPTPWAHKCWKCFLFDDDDIRRAIHYVQQNPIKDGKPPQRWSCVTPYPRA